LVLVAKCKGKIVLGHAMKARGSEVLLHEFLILALGEHEWSAEHPNSFASKDSGLRPIGWAPDPVWEFCREEKRLARARIRAKISHSLNLEPGHCNESK